MPIEHDYWFARRYPLDSPSKAMAPVNWKGYAAAGIFVAGLAIGALAFLWMALTGLLVFGVITFVIAAVVAGGWFIAVAYEKGDRARTVEDYRRSTKP